MCMADIFLIFTPPINQSPPYFARLLCKTNLGYLPKTYRGSGKNSLRRGGLWAHGSCPWEEIVGLQRLSNVTVGVRK